MRIHFSQFLISLCAFALTAISCGCLSQRVKNAEPVEVIPPNAPHFKDVAAAAGLNYHFTAPSHRPLTILDTIGNGCAFLDFDGDGNLDILLVGNKLALYKGDGKGHFKDVSQEIGIAKLAGHFLGCAVGDYDNDGFPDIYISGYGTALLLHNEAGKRFTDVTAQSGLPPQPWGTSAAWGDFDNDGKLDLYVGNYVRFNSKSLQYCNTNGVKTSCPPGIYDGIPGRLYRNLGNGHFADVTKAWGADTLPGKTLGVAWVDFDGSGRQSLAVANDEAPGELLLNHGKHFQRVGARAGIAYSSAGQPQAGMGQDWGDYDNDGLLDLSVMTFSTELKPVYHNDGDGTFTDRSSQLGLSAPLTPYVSFGTKWIDADNDGWLDILISNGHTADNIAETGQQYTYREPTVFLQNQEGQRFRQIPQPDLDKPIVGRGLAIGDFDNDGLVDALVVDSEGAPLLLHNETPDPGHWLLLHLVGTKSNRDGYGARVTVETKSHRWTRYCHADGSYLSSSDPRLHFGLGEENLISKITIRWQDGAVQSIADVQADRILTVVEGKRGEE